MALLEKLQSLLMRLALLMFGLGLLASLVGSVAGQVGLWATIFQPLLYGCLMSLVGAGLFFVLKNFVPEAIEEFELVAGPEENLEDGEGGFEETSPDEISDQETTEQNSENDDSYSDDPSSNKGALPRGGRKQTAKSGEILVEGIPIKNEPQLMAEAIKHLIDTQSD